MRKTPLDRRGKFASQNFEAKEKTARFAMQDAAADLYPESGVRHCLKHRIPGRDVEVWKSAGKDRAYYRGLQTCKDNWKCPVCAQRETEETREKWKGLLGQTVTVERIDQGGIEKKVKIPKHRVGMLTVTVGHSYTDSAAHVLDVLTKAYKRMWSGRWADATKEHYWMIGAIRGLDYVHSMRTGHHFHFHVVIVFERGVSVDEPELFAHFRQRWVECVEAVGGYASPDAVDFQAGDVDAVEYVSKLGQLAGEAAKDWGQIEEVTKSPAKRGKDADSRTLWQLLADYANGDKQAGAIHRNATAVLKGRAVIKASAGLEEKLGGKVEESPEEQPIEEGDVMVVRLTVDQWTILKALAKRGDLLELAAEGDRDGLFKWLAKQAIVRENFNIDTGQSKREIISAKVTDVEWATNQESKNLLRSDKHPVNNSEMLLER